MPLAINGTTINYMGRPDWVDAAANQSLDGLGQTAKYRRHILQGNVQSEAEFNTIHALKGQKVSLTTTNYRDRNGDYITYYGAELKQVTGRHDGPIFINVRAELLVRV